ncbi:pantoate--beta-alanine ligase [Hydrogenovibrio sp. SC-1]|uniref:pantoate--beta-alanine ligase n=1 Tax=Hydrogenovibrio sp. SC-1 TaxID=2065820 RepID=UPI000C798F97|nr:pantoate--beta-alanine ligase [Hydrogenovibrio sp. SC-1]PLA75184.1 pantoate--beta-alanine ligase [Hydrogenovibrio sp. SC-1]
MTLFESISTIRNQLQQWRQAGLRVAFVPTMGNLHAGHLSLVDIAQQHADKVVVSIFVNPMQFGPNEDYDQYPRTFEADKAALEQKSVDALFFPSVSEMYPSTELDSKVVAPVALTSILEGVRRPGHFDGVTTVVAKLFQIVQPDIAVFGQKDYQQFAVIQSMVESLFMPIELIRAEIVRDTDGLALSSRNQYLTQSQRKIAPKLSHALEGIEAKMTIGNHDYNSLCQDAHQTLLKQGFDEVDYIEIRDAKTLMPVTELNGGRSLVILGVARTGSVRLLDNRLYTQTLTRRDEG